MSTPKKPKAAAAVGAPAPKSPLPTPPPPGGPRPPRKGNRRPSKASVQVPEKVGAAAPASTRCVKVLHITGPGIPLRVVETSPKEYTGKVYAVTAPFRVTGYEFVPGDLVGADPTVAAGIPQLLSQ